MQRLLLAGLFSLAAHMSLAEEPAWRGESGPTLYRLTSVSDQKAYGLLLAAPAESCKRVSYRVADASGGHLGHTPPLLPGELAVVRMGRGFSEGEHLLRIEARGCAAGPAASRRVVLAKTSPDHGWRAAK
ncbi:MAG: hypothetical protein HC844_09965 [Tabrizicola sp.]|nr:hypothetical protein [Tabrizicola sp.]